MWRVSASSTIRYGCMGAHISLLEFSRSQVVLFRCFMVIIWFWRTDYCRCFFPTILFCLLSLYLSFPVSVFFLVFRLFCSLGVLIDESCLLFVCWFLFFHYLLKLSGFSIYSINVLLFVFLSFCGLKSWLKITKIFIQKILVSFLCILLRKIVTFSSVARKCSRRWGGFVDMDTWAIFIQIAYAFYTSLIQVLHKFYTICMQVLYKFYASL